MRWMRSVARLTGHLFLTQRHRDTENNLVFLCVSVPPCQSVASYSLDLHQEPFEFRRVRIRVDDRWREEIRRSQRGASGIFGDAAIAPVDRNADLVRLLAIDHHGF